ncbi:hypothetical protein [Chlamydia abortus]|nr:hypothetical protein [Chlamydia abortus]ASD30539.1 hypothetical protein CEF07_01975 [Chlamydia abortus]AUS59827.1 putative nucleosidase [Chlamydia abortus]QRR32063.1 hypothetical protein JS522_01955 [Chlamydia abortus]CED80427.1 conserved hypothetical protein [Chlamydia abortus]CED81387.1 conserved hypothetical protein [Chlamydia abortus]
MSAAPSNYLCKILLVLADKNEAQSLLQDFAFTKLTNHFYRCPDRHMSILIDMIILDRWGKDGVVQSLTHTVLQNYDSCVNVGFAGACSSKFPLQTRYTIDKVSQLSKDIPNQLDTTPELTVTALPSLTKATLVSAHAPYTYGFHDTFQLVDMEGYFIAELCKNLHLRCMMLKITSDYTTKEGRDYIQQHKHVLSKKLSCAFASAIYDIIELSTLAV